MKTGKLIFALVFLMLFADASMAAKWKAKHVVLIGLDGWGAYSVNKAEMPNVKKLMEEGSYTLKKRSVLPSSSAVNWASMYMGAGPELHGYTEWGSQTPELPSRVVNKHGIFPTVFSLLRESDPKAEIGCICEWAGIRYVVDTLALSYDKNITEKPQNPATAKCAVEYIKRARPALVNIVFDEPDHVGHAEGHDTPAYYEKLSSTAISAKSFRRLRMQVCWMRLSLSSQPIMVVSRKGMAARPWKKWRLPLLLPARESRKDMNSRKA